MENSVLSVADEGSSAAGSQKNVGPAGVTMVIVREDLLGNARKICPTMLDYKTMAESDSMYNTPPCWPIYVCGLTFKKLLRDGGLKTMQDINERKVLACQIAAHAYIQDPHEHAEMISMANSWIAGATCSSVPMIGA